MTPNGAYMPIETLRARARLLMWLVTLPFVCLLLLALTLLVSVVWNEGRYAGVVFVIYLPMFIYIWAIWMVRQALRSIARGAMFDQVVPRLLFRVGLALFGGALFNVFGIPIVTGLIGNRPVFLTFDGAAVTLGVVGATLVLLSQLLAQASAMREELDEFF
jgi:hypothetical protein